MLCSPETYRSTIGPPPEVTSTVRIISQARHRQASGSSVIWCTAIYPISLAASIFNRVFFSTYKCIISVVLCKCSIVVKGFGSPNVRQIYVYDRDTLSHRKICLCTGTNNRGHVYTPVNFSTSCQKMTP